MRAATRSKAIGAVQAVLLVDRFEPHRHRALDDRILARGLANGTLTPVFLLTLDALDGPCLGASALPTLVQVTPILVKMFGVRLRSDPVASRSTGLARAAGCLPQQVLLDQVGQGRAYPRSVAGRLCRNALALWCDSWCSQSLSCLASNAM
jgi:hypothetical protein